MRMGTSGLARYARAAGIVAIMSTLVGCGGLSLLPRENDIENTNFKSYQEVEAAFSSITPGATAASQLRDMGFDAAQSPNVEILSYLGVMERFMPRDSVKFDDLAMPVQSCIQARDRCTAYVFHPKRLHQERTGNILLDLFGFRRTTVNYGWSAEVVLLVQDGRVAYKVMSGKPHILDYHNKIQPLGPFQDFGDMTVRTAVRLF